jgi:hypothetical protein
MNTFLHASTVGARKSRRQTSDRNLNARIFLKGQLLLPLLETIQKAGGLAKLNEVYDALATKI